MSQSREGRESGFPAIRGDPAKVPVEHRFEVSGRTLEVEISLDLRLHPPERFQANRSGGFLQDPFNL
jgi:hypothetical protein